MAEDQDNTESSFFFSSFPALPELSCLSSSTSSSSSSFPSETWWDELKSDIVDDHNCMDFMNSITWDDHDIDVYDYKITDHHDLQPKDQQHHQQSTEKIKSGKGSKDVAAMFTEWLKSNKGLFSPEDLRKVKLKRSTIESSIQRFGGGEEGMKRLLKLILEWVQKHHIHHQGKRIRTPKEPCNITAQNRTTRPNGANFVLDPRPDHNPSFYISNWSIPHLTLPQPPQLSPYVGVSTTMADSTGGFSSMVGNTSKSIIDFNDPHQPTCDYPWSPSQFSMPSPSKEARRTRMGRQKRVSQNHIENYQHAMLTLSGSTRENCISIPATASEESEDDPAIQVYWP